MKQSSAIPTFMINPGEIHIWVINLDLLEFDSRILETELSEEELSRGRSFKFDRDRSRFFARRTILRQLLARYTGVHPNEIVYKTSPNGKLSLPSARPAFNLSASQNLVVVALTTQEEIGIDLEQVRPMEDLQQMVDLWFSAEERTRFSAIAAQEKLEAFYHAWTQKEAYLKARGLGLTDGMKNFSVRVDPQESCGLQCNKEEDVLSWKMVCTVPEPGWRLAVYVRMDMEPDIHYFSVDMNELLIGELTNYLSTL